MPKSLPVQYESADWTLSLSPLSLCSSHLLKHTHASLLLLCTKHLFYIIPVISCVFILFLEVDFCFFYKKQQINGMIL